jgi:uracil-DNA glycosylase
MQLEESWKQALKEELEKPYIQKLESFVSEERKRAVIFPREEAVFSAFHYTPYSQVKVVIVGQDPYHKEGQAHGLSFSVPEGVTPPPSIKNIFKELNRDLLVPIASHGCLIKWAKQGVLLLNTTLTVREKKPLSHAKAGWEIFTDAVVKKLIERDDPVVFLLWGRKAKEKVKLFENNQNNHVFFESGHPSPLSARLFLGCGHFSKTNHKLIELCKEPIDWRL